MGRRRTKLVKMMAEKRSRAACPARALGKATSDDLVRDLGIAKEKTAETERDGISAPNVVHPLHTLEIALATATTGEGDAITAETGSANENVTANAIATATVAINKIATMNCGKN